MYKKYFYIVTAITVFGISCAKQLDQTPVSSTTTGNFYASANDFKQAVSGAYTQLNNYPAQALWLGELRSDNINGISDGNRDWDGINNFATNITSTGFVSDAWSNNFNGIYNVNSVLQALEEKGSIITDQSLRQRYMGELYFLRAFYYFQLVKTFGKVPKVTITLTAEEISKIPRANVADIYDLIISDLKKAIDILPDTYTGADVGRATVGAANALAGQVYLTKSGPTYDIEGPGLNSHQYDSASFYLDKVISSGKYKLLNSYKSIFDYTNENNQEVIFDVQSKSGTNGSSFPSALVPVAYWVSLGISNAYGNGYGNSVFNITKNLTKSYEPNGSIQDIRDTFNINYTYQKSTFFKKYINLGQRGVSGKDWPINFIVIRYADVLLMKAESILNSGSGTMSEALAYVNTIRQRAGLTTITSITISQLLEERRREFAGEGLRWNDLIREGLAITTINNWISSDGLGTQISNASNNSILYPIPTDQISTSNGLYTQNPGY